MARASRVMAVRHHRVPPRAVPRCPLPGSVLPGGHEPWEPSWWGRGAGRGRRRRGAFWLDDRLPAARRVERLEGDAPRLGLRLQPVKGLEGLVALHAQPSSPHHLVPSRWGHAAFQGAGLGHPRVPGAYDHHGAGNTREKSRGNRVGHQVSPHQARHAWRCVEAATGSSTGRCGRHCGTSCRPLSRRGGPRPGVVVARVSGMVQNGQTSPSATEEAFSGYECTIPKRGSRR
jgi:hypothetical protein